MKKLTLVKTTFLMTISLTACDGGASRPLAPDSGTMAQNGGDAAPSPGRMDGGLPMESADAHVPVSPAEAGPGPTPDASHTGTIGTPIEVVPGQDLALRGLTSDGWIVFSAESADTLCAVPLAGGKRVDISPLVASDVKVAGRVAAMVGYDSLVVWSAQSGLQKKTPGAFKFLAASGDGKHLVHERDGKVFGADIAFATQTELRGERCDFALGAESSIVIQCGRDILAWDASGTLIPLFSNHEGAYLARPDLVLAADVTYQTLDAANIAGGAIRQVDPGPVAVNPDPERVYNFNYWASRDGRTLLYVRSGDLVRKSSLYWADLENPVPMPVSPDYVGNTSPTGDTSSTRTLSRAPCGSTSAAARG